LTETDTPKTGDINTVKEFGIQGSLKYINANVEIDSSSDNLNKLSREKNPMWAHKQLFLKVLVEGRASLYLYDDGNILRFFYSVSDSSLHQLVHRTYVLANSPVVVNADIITSNKFRSQLWGSVKCENTSERSVENLSYIQSDLEKYFISYNKCFSDSSIVYSTRKKRDVLNLKITPGLNYSSLEMNSQYNDLTFNNTMGFRVGVEGELILPFNNNKWSIIFEPTYQNIKFESNAFTLKYSSIEFPIGFRHSFFLNNHTRIFLNAFFIPGFTVDIQSSMVSSSLYELDVKPGDSYAIGGGVYFKNLSAEVRYYTSRDLLSGYVAMTTDYQRVGLIIGYKFLKMSNKQGIKL